MATDKIKFRKAVNRLAKYNGLYTASDLAADASFRSTIGNIGLSDGDQTLLNLGPSETEIEIIKLFIDSTEGAYTTAELMSKLNQLVSGENATEAKRSLRRIFPIFYTQNLQNELYGDEIDGDINSILGIPTEAAQGSNINTSANSPSKSAPGLSAIVSNSFRVGLVEKDTNPSVIFLNSVPSVEMSRATPFVNITFSIGRPSINTSSEQIQTLSLSKFLVGASRAGSSQSPLRNLTQGNQTEDSANPGDFRSISGMELFTSPQTLVNANEFDNQSIRSNPVLDKFRPLMSIASFDVSIVPSTGLMSYKSATLNLILHDRSRLSEVADFIRPDLYAKTEILIEYGWHHPDGESTTGINKNVYGDLINGMVLKEKYSILNSSFQLNDAGEIGIKLSLFTRGTEAFVTELISSDEHGTGNILREIQDLQRDVAELRSRIYGNSFNTTTREIRGVQILDAAQDALNHISLTGDLRESLNQFRNSLSNSNNPSVSTLISKLNSLYGANTSNRNNRNGNTGNSSTEPLTVRLRNSVQASIAEKMTKLSTGPDPFLLGNKQEGGRRIEPPIARTRQERQLLARARQESQITGISTGSTSLAKLLLLFVGQPLANTGKYDDVQLIFYPFNAYAGYASRINIANFSVDNEFFAQNFTRWRLDRVGRSSNVNLSDFVNFIGTTILDDPAAKSYRLIKDNKSLFRQVITEEGSNGRIAITAGQVAEPADHLSNIEEVLRGVTPDGTFRPPQIDIYLEASPEKPREEDGVSNAINPGKTILRLHIFDRLATTYDTLGALLANTRNTELAAIGTTGNAPPVNQNEDGSFGSDAVIESRVRIHNSFLRSAQAYGVIEETIPGTGDSSSTTPVGTGQADQGPTMYRIRGGTRELKKFLYKTVPYITYGTIGTNIKNAQLSSMQEPSLNTVNLLRSFRRSELEPNGENPGGIPMRIIPTVLTLNTNGCPLINFAQQYFVDFQTGTTADNIYGVSGLTHTFSQGEFNTSIKFAPMDAYGRYISVIDQVRNSQAVLQDIEDAGRTPQDS